MGATFNRFSHDTRVVLLFLLGFAILLPIMTAIVRGMDYADRALEARIAEQLRDAGAGR